MKPEDAELEWDGQCAVCGKSVGHGEGFSHLKIEKHDDRTLLPPVLRNIREGPAKYLGRRTVRKNISGGAPPPGSFSAFDQ